MKRIITFALEGNEYVSVKKSNKTSQFNGVELDVVFFTTAFNRNKAYFQVADLLYAKNRPEKLLVNINHDLKITGGKYFGNTTRHTLIDSRVKDGVFEVYGKIVSSDPYIIKNKDDITGVSIEIVYDDKDTIQTKEGIYITDFEWVATAILMGVPAGSGDTRLENIRTFSADGSLTELPTNDLKQLKMNPEELKNILSEVLKVELEQIKTEVVEINKKIVEIQEKGEDREEENELKNKQEAVQKAMEEQTKKQNDFSSKPQNEELVVDPSKDAIKTATTSYRVDTLKKLI